MDYGHATKKEKAEIDRLFLQVVAYPDDGRLFAWGKCYLLFVVIRA